MTDALARCCTICMVSWESCAMLTRWRTAVQYAGSYRSGSNFRQKGVRNGHLEMLKAATVAAAPRQQQQCWTRPCNDSSQLREIEVSIGANKEKRASLLSTPAVTASARSRKIVACTILRLIQASVGTINKKKLLAHVEQEITPKHAHVTDRNGRDCREKGQAWTIPEPSSLPEPSSYQRDKSGTERASGRQ